MGKRNQITADLRIQADAQLKNSSAFIKQLERMTDKFDFGDKMNKQILDAQEQLKGYNKVLEKIKGKSVISDDELKNLVKAGKEIANVISKTEKLYSGMGTAELQKYSKAYIAQIKAQEEAALKIKQDYFNKTGKVYDKEIKNLDKYENKITDLQKQIKALNDSKDDTIDAAIKRENARLQEQFDLLQKIKKTQAELANSKDSAYANSSSKSGFSEKELKSKVNTNREDVAKDVANAEYKNLLNTYQAISKERDEILKSSIDALEIEKALIQLANKYNLTSVQTTEEFEKQLAILEQQKNFYRLLQNRGQLATEEKVNAEVKRRNDLLKEQKRLADEIAASQADILGDNGFNSTKQMNSQARNAKEILNGKNVQLTVDGASLTENGEDDIATQVSNSIKQNTDRVVTELKKAQDDYDDLQEPMNKLATQSERAADENDIKDAINVDKNQENQTRAALKDSETNINATTEASDNEVAKRIIRELSREDIVKSGGLINKGLDLLSDEEKFGDEAINVNKEILDKQLAFVTDNLEAAMTNSIENYEEFNKVLDEIVDNLDSMIPALKEEKGARQVATKDNIDSLRRKYGGDINSQVQQELEQAIKKETQDLKREEKVIDQAIDKINLLKRALAAMHQSTSTGADVLHNYGNRVDTTAIKIEKAAQQTQYLGSTFDDIKNKIGYFLSLNYIFDIMTQKIREAAQTTEEMDKDMTQIGLVLGQTSTQVWKNFDTYADMADRLNTTVSDVTGAMKLFYQQGLNTAEVNKMVEASAIAAALGESTMAEASETLTSIINSYSLTAEDAISVTDKISQVAIASAADFGEISIAIEKVASSAASAGLDLDHMMGYLGKMIETTREAPTNIGTALKTIVANFTQFKEDPTGLGEEGTEINKVDTALRSVGISLTDFNGEVRDLGDVLDELGGKWDSLTRNQKAYLATQIAGTRQQSRFYALMNDYDRTLELVEESTNSAGKANQQFELYQDSLTASTQKLNNEWEKFYNSILKNDSVLKGLKNTAAAVLGVANKLGAELTLLASGGIVKGLRTLWSSFAQMKEEIKESNSLLLSTNAISSKALKGNHNILEGYNLNHTNTNFLSQPFSKWAQKNFEKKGGNEQVAQLQKLLETQNALKDSNIELLTSNQAVLESFLETSEVTEVLDGNISTTVKNKAEDAVATQAGTVAHTASASVKWAEVAAQLALNIAITAGIAAIGAIVVGLVNWYNADKNAAIAAADHARTMQTAYEDLKNEYEDLKVVIEDYQKSLEALDRLIEGTDEWKQSVQELNSQVIELMGTFPELAKFISANSEGVFVISDEGLEKIQELQANTLSQAEVGSIVATQVANDAKIRLQQNEIANGSYISSTKEDAWKGVNTEFFNVRHATEDDESVGDNSLSGYVSLKEQGMEKLYNEWKLNPSLFKEGSEDKLAAIIGTENKELITTIQKLEDKIIEWGKSIDLNTESNKILNQQIIHSYLGQNGSEEYQGSDYKAQIDSLLADEYETKKKEKLEDYNSKGDDTVHNEFAAAMGYTEIGGGFQVGKSKFVDKDGKELTFSDEYMREYLAGEAAKKEITNTEEGLSKEVNDLGVKLTGMFGEDAGKSLMSKFADGMDLNTLSPEDVKSIKESIDNGTLQLSETEAKLLGYNGSEQFKATVINAADNYNAIPYWQNQYTTSSKNAGDLQSSLNILSTGSEEDLEEEQISYLETLEAKYIELGEIKDRTSHEYLELLRQIKEQEETNAATALDETRILQEKQLQEAQDKLAASQAELAKDLTDEEREQIEMDIVANTEEVEKALKALSETKQKITVQLDADLKSDVEDAFGLANEFANLKDLLKENYEITFEEAQEIAARGFGAILQNAKETSDQTIKLDEDTVNAYIDGKQTELSRDKEAKIKQLENQKTLLQTSLGLLQQEQAALTEVATAETEQDAQVALAKAMNYEAQYQAKRQELEEEVKADNEANKTMDENATKLYESLSGMYEVNADNEQEATDAADKASAEHANNVIEYYKAMNNTVRQFANQVAVATQGKDNGEIKQGGVGSGGITVNDAGQKETTSGYTGEAKTIEDTLKDLVGGISDDSATRLSAMKQAAAQMSKDVSDRINTIQNQIGEIDSGIAALKSADTSLDKWQATKGGATGGGGSDDEYEGMIEKLEHFYNYLRQIEALEEKINKIRERRNLIDATQNYYIDDLIQENELLKEQAALYGNYINDEVEYLALLRNQLSAAYGDWVYFNDEGVVQVKQTEFAINSEEEEERYNAFSELLEEYQNEYNTMLQNQNLLYNIQATIIENINTSYDKILKRITDVAEQLEYINSISEHWVEMSFGSIEKLPLLNDQIKTTADMLLNAQKGVNELNGDFEKLNQTIQNSDFTSLLTWDEELGHYKVNNEAMADPKVREQFEAQGYNWAEVETWVNSMAAASQKITTSVKETNTELMSARAQLKDLLEERISTISEIFEKATEEINKFYGIYEKKIEALGTENDLFGTKSENIDAQYDYLMNVAGHSKALLESLKKNNQDILDTLTKDYGDYVQMIDGVAYINKMAIEESDTLTEAQKADLLQLYQLYYESQDQIEEVNDKFYDYISQIEELERAKRDAIIDLKNQLHDELIAKDQEEIDELSEKYDKMSALDNEYYSQLQQRINDARDARSRLQNQQDLAQMQNRLSVLQRDNSGQYNSELVELQRQINERLQAQADQNVDLEMERIAREQQQREEDRQMQITQMENLLTFKDENGMYWEMAQDIINNGTASVIGTLMSSKESEDQSDEARKQQLEDLQDTTEMAKAELSSGKEYLASNFREDLEKYVKEPVENLDIPGEMATHAGTVADQIAHGTQVFINTMSGLFRLLNEANGKSEAGGYTTGMIDDNGIYTPPTKKPVEPPKPAPAPSNNSSNSGAPELKVGNHVEVKPGTKWYYDSYGTSPTGKARSGKIKYINLKGSRPYNIEGLGWIRKEDIQGYSKGGYVDYTGIAAVHGKAGKPEAFLNAKQTQLFETLRDALVKVPTMSSKETDNSENITIENLTIDVKELADTDSVDKIVRTVKQSIYKDATSGNNMKINRR